MVLKEFEASKNDLETARRSLNEEDHKWATVQAYYSMFHAAKALLYSKGFREKSHRGLLAALRQLYPREIPGPMLDDFREAMELRESADYGLVWSEESASDVLDTAEAFLDKAKTVIRLAGTRSILDLAGFLTFKEAAEVRSKVGEIRGKSRKRLGETTRRMRGS